MKNLILALAVATLPVVAHAQKSYSNGESVYDQNYKVCRIDGTYTVCSENTPTIVNTKKAANKNDKTIAQLHKLDRYVYVNPEPRVVNATSKKNPRFGASYDDPNAAYQGKESAINDGVDKTISRNINYINNNTNLPPNDGGNSDKK
ncbi:MAG: hypothetical protein JST70_00430 [Bacteroidetes bacterium]|nr:hypothetical protein [Bacteroidota bacterium]